MEALSANSIESSLALLTSMRIDLCMCASVHLTNCINFHVQILQICPRTVSIEFSFSKHTACYILFFVVLLCPLPTVKHF